MKKLIAQRPIQYMGRTYERGEAIPAQDPKMVAAWLKANSAAWTGTDVEDAARAAIREAARRSRVNDQAAEAIRAMGVTIEDTAGEFVGASSMEEQIRALFAPGGLQNGGGTGEGQDHGDGGNAAQGGQNAPGEGENGQGGGAPAMLTGHLDAAKLERMKKEDLLDLAAKLGVDVSAAKNQRERAQLIAAAEVQAHATDPENGGGAL
ncbi:hypothetical protein D1159_04620 [Pseudoflavonifractor sp. 524-17]|uniref:hypothetical protein n=1 Tax=Pseudoflavonifractor sp. 524-17 TaxID=2304577 RepID=UPI00137B3052|nr:hypothetical protein [Pseudoflavonifractor sp. 524-17]NCE63882.1 hypothetical protein [Pseudoflavonifractor sp. 524-17]